MNYPSPSLSSSPVADGNLRMLASWVASVAFCADIDAHSDAHLIYASIVSLLASPYQTPFTLFHILVFLRRFFDSFPSFGSVIEEDGPGALLDLMKMLFCVAVEIIGDVEGNMPLAAKLSLTGYTHDEYLSLKQHVLHHIASLYTNTTEIGANEWDLYHASMPLSHGTDMAVTQFLDWAQPTSFYGNIPLHALFSEPALPNAPRLSEIPLAFSSCPTPLPEDSYLHLFPSPPPSIDLDFSSGESLNPDDFYLAPEPSEPSPLPHELLFFGSSSEAKEGLHVYQPRPTRPIRIDTLLWEVEEKPARAPRDEAFYRAWIECCLAL